jgi:hypothetical protein
MGGMFHKSAGKHPGAWRSAVILSRVDLERCFRGDRVGLVQKEQNNPTGRGYLLDIELASHTDLHEVMALASVAPAAEGGLSGVVSGLAVHDEIAAAHPEHLAALYEGFYHTGAPDQPLTARKVPVFARVDGTLSCYYHGMLWRLPARRMGVAHAAGRTGLDYGEFFGTRSATA